MSEPVTAQQLRDRYGYWNEHPLHPFSDWQHEAANGDTRQGYWEWVADHLNRDENHS